MKKMLVFTLLGIICGLKLKAQAICEFDSIFNFKENEYSIGYKAFESEFSNYFLLNFSGLGTKPGIGEKSILTLSKLNKCGNKIWSYSLDSGLTVSSGLNCTGFSNFHADNDGDLTFSAYYSRVEKEARGIRLIKTDSTGVLRFKRNIVDTNLLYFVNDFKKLTPNKFLFWGYADSVKYLYTANNNKWAFAMLSDSMGNILYHRYLYNDLKKNSLITSAYYNDSNQIILMGVEDSTFHIFKMDTEGNVVNLLSKKTNIKCNYIGYNYTNTEILVLGYGSNYASYFARLDLDANIIKDTLFTLFQLTSFNFKYSPQFIQLEHLSRNKLLIPFENHNVIIDSNFHVLYCDSFPPSQSTVSRSYYAFLSRDSYIVNTGFFNSSTGGNSYKYSWIKKSSLKTLVKSIEITGINIINQNSGSIQLNSVVLPTTAFNKNVVWSINDSILARISQTGILTAKANGIVTVTAKTTDGSNLAASKQITITNQGVGLLKNDLLDSQIEIFPNPASTHVTVLSKDLKIKLVQLIDIQGKTLNTFTNPEHIYLNNFTNGYFFLKIETDKGTVYKKLVINK